MDGMDLGRTPSNLVGFPPGTRNRYGWAVVALALLSICCNCESRDRLLGRGKGIALLALTVLCIILGLSLLTAPRWSRHLRLFAFRLFETLLNAPSQNRCRFRALPGRGGRTRPANLNAQDSPSTRSLACRVEDHALLRRGVEIKASA